MSAKGETESMKKEKKRKEKRWQEAERRAVQ
jgi:hypothetical protein